MNTIGSRDLSASGGRSLNVTIEGYGTRGTDFPNETSLATHVNHVDACLTGYKRFFILNPADAPWEIVSFDRAAQKLVVRPVLD